MSRLLETYQAIHEQGFIPIFVKDDFDTKVLLEGCLDAGLRVIEYTLRRPDAHEMLPWIRHRYPDLHILVGSTMDDDRIVIQRRRRYPQLLTLTQLDSMGVDGFVSLIGWHPENIQRFSPRRIVAPAAWTVTEAFQEVAAGAHFIKLTGPASFELARLCRSQSTFGYCPILITGGITLERIPLAFEAGAVTVASGFDITLQGKPRDVSSAEVADVMRDYVAVAKAASKQAWPDLSRNATDGPESWLDALPHYHPFCSDPDPR